MQVLNKSRAVVCSMVWIACGAAWSQSPSSAATSQTSGTGPAIGQTGGTRVHGTVADPSGAVIPGALVTLTPSKGSARSVKSGSDGSYALTVAPGSYTLVVSMEGFASYSMTNLRVPAVPSTTVDAKLAIGEATQVVNVEASTVELSVDQDSNASATVISGKDLEALSDDPDELSSELSALAGPSAGPNGGQIYVDGFTGGQLPPKSSIREIRINQNPFSAQYDRLGFGRVEVFTKPGTDKFHGSFQANGNPSQFNSGNPLQTVATAPYHTIFMFGNITGPLSKTSSFSVGGSHRDIEDAAFTNVTIPTLPGSTVLCAPGQAGCVAGTSVQYSTNTPQVRTDISPRFDFALGEKNVLTARFQYVQNDLTNGGIGNLALPSVALNTNSKTAEIQLSDTQTWTSKLINETRFEWQRDRASDNALNNSPLVSVSGAFSSGGSSVQNTSDHSDHFEVQNYTSIQLAKSFVRFGGRLRVNRDATTPLNNTNGSFTYATTAAYLAGTPSQFTLTRLNARSLGYTLTDVGLYAESDWKARPNLTISYGLRFEAQNYLADHSNVAPRLSFAYGVPNGKGTPKTVIRGGFGMFYDRFGAGSVGNLVRLNGINTTSYTLSAVPANCTPSSLAACTAGATANTATTYSQASGLHAPYILQYAVGFDRQISRTSTVSVNYLHADGRHELATQNVAYPITTFPSGQIPASYQYFTEGAFHQDQLTVNGRAQTSRRISLFGYYSLNFARGNTSGNGSPITTPYNLNADYGRTGFDTRNRGLMGGSISLPHFMQVSPFMIAQSGNPYNITVGSDVNGDTFFNDRPYRVTGVTTNNSTVKAIGGCGTFATAAAAPAGSSLAPINACTGPALFTFNFRFTKTWGFGEQRSRSNGGDSNGQPGQGGPPGGGRGPGGGGRGGPGGGMFGGGGSSTGRRYNVSLGAQIMNLFNNSNLAAPNGTLLSPLFGQSTQLEGGPFTTNAALRRLSLQASFNF